MTLTVKLSAPRRLPAASAESVAAVSSVGAAPMIESLSHAMGEPIVAIRPTMMMNTPTAGPIAEIRPTRNAVFVISGSIFASTAVLRARRENKSDCTSETTTVTEHNTHTVGRLAIRMTSFKFSIVRPPSKINEPYRSAPARHNAARTAPTITSVIIILKSDDQSISSMDKNFKIFFILCILTCVHCAPMNKKKVCFVHTEQNRPF